MLTKRVLLSLAATLATTASQYQGFNYASTNADGSTAYQADFENLFTTAQNLVGAPGFTSARLYTMIQDGTTNTPIEAIPAAIKTKTSLLLGMWASAGDASFNNELAALSSALQTYGSQLSGLIAGLSVGSEDLYRETPIGIASDAGPGASAATISSYIQQARAVLQKAGMSGVKVGHVDTWTAWVNGSNAAAVSASDFLGLDAYPYFQKTDNNVIGNSANLFESAFQKTSALGKEVWITETGYPTSGAASGAAIASVANAKTYWDAVACKYMGTVNTWWYTLYDGTPTSDPSFGITGPTLSTTPAFSLKCAKHVAAAPKPSHSSKPKSSSTKASKTSKTTETSKTQAHSKTVTSHKAHATHATKQHNHTKQGHHHKQSTKTSAGNQKLQPSPTTASGAPKNAQPKNSTSSAGVVKPSVLLMAGMLALWCL